MGLNFTVVEDEEFWDVPPVLSRNGRTDVYLPLELWDNAKTYIVNNAIEEPECQLTVV